MRITILNPTKVVYEGNAKEVVLPGEDGEFSILDFHQTFLYRLRKGCIRVITSLWEKGGDTKGAALKERRIQIRKGVARMVKNEIVIVAEVLAS
jgi:F0F1-type ATP synthase epsilon subunit